MIFNKRNYIYSYDHTSHALQKGLKRLKLSPTTLSTLYSIYHPKLTIEIHELILRIHLDWVRNGIWQLIYWS